jgi:hypothetical protein
MVAGVRVGGPGGAGTPRIGWEPALRRGPVELVLDYPDPFDVLNDHFLGRAGLEGRAFTGVLIDRRMRAAGQLTGARCYLAYDLGSLCLAR